MLLRIILTKQASYYGSEVRETRKRVSRSSGKRRIVSIRLSEGDIDLGKMVDMTVP